jgi:hypothetical protein
MAKEEKQAADRHPAQPQSPGPDAGAIGDFVRSALTGTKFEALAGKLAEEFGKTNLTKATLHNAPLKLRVTHGANIYEVVAILQKAAGGE